MGDVPVPLAVTSDQSDSIAFASQRLVNAYPEMSRFGAKSPFVLLGTPALRSFTTAGVGPHRGHVVMNELLYVVSGPALFRIDSDGTATNLGAIDGDGYVSMATAGTQIGVATSLRHGFIYDSSTGITQQITDPDFFGGTSVTALDGYFLWSSGGDNLTRFQPSALLNGLSYDALDFASAESTNTVLMRLFLMGTQILMMKPDRMEVWYDSGAADFPFARLNSTIIPKGLAAKFSPAFLDNTVFWLGRDEEAGGGPIAYRLNGYLPEVISTNAVSTAMAGVENLDQIRGVAYIKGNHAFYGLILPTGNSWWYDCATGIWHERATYGMDRWLGNTVCSAYGKTLIGSSQDGAIYEFGLDSELDAGTLPLVLDVTLPTYGLDMNLKRCGRLRLDMETGVGTSTGQGAAPVVVLNISDDRGKTFGSDMPASIGLQGEYGIGVEWRRMGQFRSRVHRFRISDPVKRAFVALFANIQ